MWWLKEEKLLSGKVRLQVSIVVTELEFQVSFNSELRYNKSTQNTKVEIWISVAKTHIHRHVILQHTYLSQWGFIALASSQSWTTTHFYYLWMNTQHTATLQIWRMTPPTTTWEFTTPLVTNHCITRELLFFLLATYYSNNWIKNIGWARHMACMWEKINRYRLLVGTLKLRHLSRDGRIILKWISNRQDGRSDTGLIWVRVRKSCGLLWTWS